MCCGRSGLQEPDNPKRLESRLFAGIGLSLYRRCTMGEGIAALKRLRYAVAAAVLIWPGASWAQDFPTKPVRYVIPFDPGSSPDVVGRVLSDRLAQLWGQPVVVENKVGAAGTLAAAYVAKAPADGYTLFQANIAPNAIAVSLYAKVPYDQLRDFAPITRIGMTPNIITVHPSVPLKS